MTSVEEVSAERGPPQPLSDEAVDTLVGTHRHITSPYVFWHHDGKRHSTFANSFVLIARRAEVPFRCHDLRHAFAGRFLQATGDTQPSKRSSARKPSP
jgi:integrase/recombinase XerD